MTIPSARPWAPTLRRSIRLLREFRYEQPDPDRFYSVLADDSVAQLGAYTDLDSRVVLDVGGGPGYFARAFEAAGACYCALDASVGELSGRGSVPGNTLLGSGLALPFADGSVDVCYSSNVLEHVNDPWRMADEMLRVTRPGGLTFISFTVWYGPWGGHETAPWHYLGGYRARRRYVRRTGHEPKNRFGESLFAVSVAATRRWADRQRRGEVLAFAPRYHPSWAQGLVHVPGVREIVTWNLMVVLRRQ